MRSKSDGSFLTFRESPFTAAAVTLTSLFSQWLNWFAYEKIGYVWGITLVTPLILCIIYHFVQLDGGREGSFSRRFVFIFGVAVPLLAGVVLTVIMLTAAPEISVFSPEADYEGTVREVIATYAGRFMFTSLYLMIFAVIDIPVLRNNDKKGKKR